MSFIQNLFTSRDNGANAETYVGQEGRLWWDPLTNSMYYSDGNTPGGIPVGAGGNPFNQVLNTNSSVTFANVTVTGNINTSNTATVNLGNFTINDQTLAGTVEDRTIRLSPVGNASVQVLNGIQVYQGSFSTNPLFSVTPSGVVSTLVPNAVSYLGAFEIVGNPTATTVPPQNYGVMLHTTGVQDTPARIYNDGVNNYGAFINRRYNGTSAAPTGVLANQIVGRLGATAYLLDDIWPTISGTRLDFVTTEDQTTTQQGSEIQMWATPQGETSTVIVGQFTPGQLLFTGNIIPNSTTSLYSLGNSTHKWGNLYLGPDSLFIEDTVTHLNAELTVEDGTLFINGTNRIQVGNMQMTTDGISLVTANTGSNIQIGASGDTGYMQVNMPGIKFRDNSIQTTAGIPLSQRANAGGVATLGLDGIVPANQLPGGGPVYKGTWNATTNSPTLVDGTGSGGDEYAVIVAGTQNLGSGPITFNVGDFVIYNGTIWQKIPGIGSGVTSFNTRTGAVTLTSSDVTTALTSGSLTNAKLANANIAINTGAGLSGGATIALGGSVTLVANVVSVAGGTGVTVANSSGNYTVSIGQPVGTANSVQFLAVSASTTIQATGNVTGGNLTTGGKVVATGNIETSGNLVTSNTTINSSITSNGNVTFSGANVTLGTVANVHITGGSAGKFLTTDGTGNLSWANVAGANVTGTVPSATVATSANSVAGANVTGAVAYATTANSVAGANVSGQVANALVAGTVYTNAQPNITSVGTQTNFTSNGNVNFSNASNVTLGAVANVHVSGGSSGQFLSTDGAGNLSWASSSSSQTVAAWTPTIAFSSGGSVTYVQQAGEYIKSGRSVTCYFTIQISGVSGASGTVRIGNLPYTATTSVSTYSGGGALDNYTFAVLPVHVTGSVPSASSYMDLFWHDRSGSTNSLNLMTTGELGTSATLIGRITYISAS